MLEVKGGCRVVEHLTWKAEDRRGARRTERGACGSASRDWLDKAEFDERKVMDGRELIMGVGGQEEVGINGGFDGGVSMPYSGGII